MIDGVDGIDRVDAIDRIDGVDRVDRVDGVDKQRGIKTGWGLIMTAVRTNGTKGELIVKTWAMMLGLIITIVSATIGVYSFITYGGLTRKVDEVTSSFERQREFCHLIDNRVAVLESQYGFIATSLERIEKKID